MSELKQRLQNASAACIEAYEAWQSDVKNDAARGKLMDTVHELRKVSSRLEIEIALNDRKNTNAKRIPIPEHKSKMENRKDQKPLSEILPVAELKEARRKKLELQAAEDDHDDDFDPDAMTEGDDNNQGDDHNNDAAPAPRNTKPKRQRTPRRRRPEGGHNGNDDSDDNGNNNGNTNDGDEA